MQLVEAGKLDLDADVNKYLDFKIPEKDGKPATLRQIMTHTAGFEETAKDLIYFDPKYHRSLGEYLKAWTPRRIYKPGSTPAYSNWGTAVAGYIVERQSGESFDNYVEKHIFQPLGMQYASFRQPLPANLKGQMSQGYPKPGQDPNGFEIIGPAPAGSLSASGTDMAKFMLAHLQQGKGILSPATAAMMHNSPLDKVDPFSLLPPLNRMELGFFETNINGREVIGHLGDTVAFHTSLHLFMAEGVGLYVSFNSPGKEGAVGGLRTALFQDFADRYFPAVKPASTAKVDDKTAAEHAKAMAGLWDNSRRSDSSFLKALYFMGQTAVTVGPKGELVIPDLHGLNGRPREWVETSPYVWTEKNGHEQIAAKVVDGKVVRWSMGFMSPFMVFDRVPGGQSSAWLNPVLLLSIGVLLLTFLFWPIGWFVRRQYKAPFTVAGRSLKAYRAVRIMSGLDLVMLGGWMMAVTALMGDLENSGNGFDFWLWLLQIAGAIIFPGALLVAGWNAYQVWTDGRRWARKTWSVLLVLATFFLLYFAFTFGLIAMTVNY
jgi:CubicO group peptidase (beta-lactamase class C family)